MNKSSAQLNFIHISESLAAGVLKSVVQIANAQAEDDHRVKVQYLERRDTPSIKELKSLAPDVSFERIHKSNLVGMIILILRLIVCNEYHEKGVIIHAHSTWAGVLTRLSSKVRPINQLFYTPHCFAFLRMDISKIRKKLYLVSEQVISKISSATVIACGLSEAQIATAIGCKRVNVGINFVDIPELLEGEQPRDYLSIGNVGRISFQKNPERFAEIVKLFPETWKGFWYGDGHDILKAKLLESGVKISGWIPISKVSSVYKTMDYFLITSDWEGAPFTLLESMAHGVIPIASNYVGVGSIIKDGQNGFIYRSNEEAIEIISSLQADPLAKEQISNRAREFVVKNHNLAKIGIIWPTFYNLNQKN